MAQQGQTAETGPTLRDRIGLVFRGGLRIVVVALSWTAAILTAGVLALSIAFLLGWEPIELSSAQQLLRPAVATFGGSLIVATVRQLVETLPQAWDFIAQKQFGPLLRSAGTVFVAALGFVLAFFALEERAPAAWSTVVLPFPAAPVPDRDDDPLFTFYVTFADDASVKALDARRGRGFRIAKADASQLQRIVTDIARCAPGPEHRVHFRVVGFASSSPPDDATGVDPDDFNLRVANLRARRVVQVIEDAIGDDQRREPEKRVGLKDKVKVSLRQWDDFDSMVAARDFEDRIAGAYSSSMARLTRRVEVHLIDASACQRSDPWNSGSSVAIAAAGSLPPVGSEPPAGHGIGILVKR